MSWNLYEKIKSYIYCTEENKEPEPSPKIDDLKIPLLSTKHSNDETTVVAKNRHIIVQLVSLILRKRSITFSNIFIEGDYLIIEMEKTKFCSFFVEAIKVDDTMRFSCTITFNKLQNEKN
jgi:hypothetical protein